MKYLLLLINFTRYFAILAADDTDGASQVDASKTLVFGPGLNPDLVFPARYFYIQAVDNNGKNFSSSPGDVFIVQIETDDGRCRIWTQTLDRHDGSFIARYKLYQTCTNLRIKVTYENQPVGDSPYRFKGSVYHEDCYCPHSKLDTWLDQMGCPSSYTQIERDLSIFSNIDMTKAVNEAKQRFHQAGSYSVCHYAIINNELYRECIGQHVGFKMFMDALLLSLLRKAHFPDVEFIVNLGDWPLEKRPPTEHPIPIFSWCKSEDTRDIVMPTYDLTESTLETMGRVMLDMMSVQCNTGPPWENKTTKGIWRGRDSRRERLNLVGLARKHPDLIDAALTNFFFFRDMEEEYGPTVKHMSFFDFFKFKMQINVDGTVAAYRFPYLLAGDSVVLKQESEYYEHFYKLLQPWVHYIPFKRDLSDLVERLNWVLNNDAKAKQIAQNGRKFAQENLMPQDIFCYSAVLLERFSQKLRDKPEQTKSMEHVPQPHDPHNVCSCQRNLQNKDEL